MIIKRWLFLFSMLVLSGCSHYHQSPQHFSADSLKKSPSQYASVQNGRIEYYRFSRGSPVILIAGYATDVSSWSREFLAALAERHEVIVFNNRNVGGSKITSEHYESRDLANDLAELVQKLNLRKPAILGISMGGMIAQQFAVLHPDKISHLILINTAIAGKKAVHPNPDVEKKMLDMPSNKFRRYALAVQLFSPPLGKMQMAYDLAVKRFQPHDYQESNLEAIIPKQRDLVMRWVNDNATANKIRKLNVPVLILNGKSDTVIPPINSLILANAIPKSRLVRWCGGGHAMIYQYPEQIANTISEFIAND